MSAKVGRRMIRTWTLQLSVVPRPPSSTEIVGVEHHVNVCLPTWLSACARDYQPTHVNVLGTSYFRRPHSSCKALRSLFGPSLSRTLSKRAFSSQWNIESMNENTEPFTASISNIFRHLTHILCEWNVEYTHCPSQWSIHSTKKLRNVRLFNFKHRLSSPDLIFQLTDTKKFGVAM